MSHVAQLQLRGHSTGFSATPFNVRVSFAFDLCHVDFAASDLQGAVVHVQHSLLSEEAAFELYAGTANTLYASRRTTAGARGSSFTLNRAALRDLKNASGAFFAIDGKVPRSSGRAAIHLDALTLEVQLVRAARVQQRTAA
jgi:hypothetical protein